MKPNIYISYILIHISHHIPFRSPKYNCDLSDHIIEKVQKKPNIMNKFAKSEIRLNQNLQ
jgi:hypothetical protein